MFNRSDVNFLSDKEKIELFNMIINMLHYDYICMHDDFYQLFEEAFKEIPKENHLLLRNAKVEMTNFWINQNNIQSKLEENFKNALGR
jgi:hypothetical protein